MRDCKPEIRKLMELHRGRQTAIKRQDIAEALNLVSYDHPRLSSTEDRQLRLQIEELRKTPFPIMYATSNPMGYYLPNTDAESKEGCALLLARIRAECILLAKLKRSAHRFVAKEIQGELL